MGSTNQQLWRRLICLKLPRKSSQTRSKPLRIRTVHIYKGFSIDRKKEIKIDR